MHMVGTVVRRFLISYPVPQAVLANYVPPGAQCSTHDDLASVSACFVRMDDMRPNILPRFVGMGFNYLIHRTRAKLPFPDGKLREAVLVLQPNINRQLLGSFGSLLTGVGFRTRQIDFTEDEDNWRIRMGSQDELLYDATIVKSSCSTTISSQSRFETADQADEFLLAIGSYDIIVALEGPRRPATVRRKERVAGIWVNRHSVRFEPIPASYSISSTRPLDSIAKQIVLSAHDVGIQNIRLVPTGQIGDGSMIGSFREAMLRIMQQSGLYQRDPSGVQFISQSLFRASVRLPANIPVGGHTVRAELYRNGQYVTQKTIQLRVVKTGLEQFTYNLAHQYSLIYGIIAVAFALFTGWLSSVIFRKD